MMYPTMYTVDSMDRVRVWFLERDGSRYRTHSGVEGGKIAVSGWTQAEPKNVGKSNETTAEEQAQAEILAEYTKKRDRKYYDDRSLVAGAKFFSPMLASKFEAKKAQFPCWAQPKLDGIRCIITMGNAHTRQGKPILTIPHILDELEPVFLDYPDLVLDGELYNHDLKDDFNQITSMVRQQKPTEADWVLSEDMVQYHVYDVGISFPFTNRQVLLDDVFAEYKLKSVVRVPTSKVNNISELDDLYGLWLAGGYEGQMVRYDGLYECAKRSKSLLKRKEFLDAEFQIKEVIEGNGNWSGSAKAVEFYLPDGRTCRAGIKGDQQFTRYLLKNGLDYGKVTVRYFTPTPDGMPRFPVAVDWHIGERVD